DQDPTSGIYQYQNASEIVSYGVNAGYEATLGDVTLGLNATGSKAWIPSTQDQVDPIAWNLYGKQQPVPAAPNFSGNARIAYRFGDKLPTLGLAMSLLGPRLAMQALTDPELLELARQGHTAKVPTSMQLRATVTG